MLNWSALEAACGGCRNCSLCETRHHVVFGEGLRRTRRRFFRWREAGIAWSLSTGS